MARFTGTAGNDVITGTVYRDIIDGGLGDDTMTGGLDHDTYYVNSALDDIVENAGEGTDWVNTTVSYTAHANVEHVRALGTGNINLTGNAWDNTLIGTRGNNILIGGAGSDTAIGGAGDDLYLINIFSEDGINWGPNARGDVIMDTSGRNDTVAAIGGDPEDEVLYIMQRDLEHADFSLLNSSLTITGNNSNNIISNGDGDDVVDGGRGGDTMDAGDGANTITVDSMRDFVIDTFDDVDGDNEPEEDIADTLIVKANYVLDSNAFMEFITLDDRGAWRVTGSDSKNIMTGNSKANSLNGAGGNDTLIGFGGADIMTGGLGADVFKFTEESLGSTPRPIRIMDFNVAQGDALDIADIISFEEGAAISNYIQIIDKGRDSIVKVNVGEEGAANFVHMATIVGVTGLTGTTALFLGGNIILETDS